MAGKTSKKSRSSARKAGGKPVLLAGGNPQIPKGDGDALSVVTVVKIAS